MSRDGGAGFFSSPAAPPSFFSAGGGVAGGVSGVWATWGAFSFSSATGDGCVPLVIGAAVPAGGIGPSAARAAGTDSEANSARLQSRTGSRLELGKVFLHCLSLRHPARLPYAGQ